ncbi:MAG: hypothetical protein VKO21_02155 [Candidatus Sericytochromatia bacterium]|nr:hypothetical protein [Candidatus Sericytochromatia bacterium]
MLVEKRGRGLRDAGGPGTAQRTLFKMPDRMSVREGLAETFVELPTQFVARHG